MAESLHDGDVAQFNHENMNNEAGKIESDSKKPSKSGKKSTKQPMNPEKLTPEYIQQQRQLREARKSQKKVQTNANTQKPQFIHRSMLKVPEALPNESSLSLKIMTYNVLAQLLIKRSLFPTNGAALKWGWRGTTLLDEIMWYSPDVFCLQEVDESYYLSFWRKQFEAHGYGTKFHKSPSKAHGVCIGFKNEVLVCKNQSFVDFDLESVPGLPDSRSVTGNVGMLSFLQFQPKVIEKYKYLADVNGVILGTTHLYWHPFGCFERTRQTYLILKKCKEFHHTLTTVLDNNKGLYTFFAGDMNTEPFDYPYLSITAKPIHYRGKSKEDLMRSIIHLDNRLKSDDDKRNEDELDCSEEQLSIIEQLENAHNSLDMRAISLYSIGYKQVHGENSGIGNERNEPEFSNWAHSWRGLLDYIFVISRWNVSNDSHSNMVDSIEDVEKNQNIKLISLLRMPTKDEMGPEPSGQPRVGQYPSDHLCMMAEIQLV
jgi:RNA exonuclease NGL2